MAPLSAVIFVVCLSCAVLCKPIEDSEHQRTYIQQTVKTSAAPRIWKRFINPSLTVGGGSFAEMGTNRLRTKRDTEDCEKLQLCKLHAESGHSFFATFELYFVNKENARLWDHRAHTMADCKNKYSGCQDDETPAAAAAPTQTKHKHSESQKEQEAQKEEAQKEEAQKEEAQKEEAQIEQDEQETDFVGDEYES